MNTFSKSLTPTIRISYMVLPVHLVRQFYRKMSFYSCTVSNFEQYTLAEFINLSGNREDHHLFIVNYSSIEVDKIKEAMKLLESLI